MKAIRRAARGDAAAIAALLIQLEFDVTADDVAESWDAWEREDNVAYIAVHDGSAAGLVTVHRMTVLHRPRAVGRITSLVVDASRRGEGIGRKLVDTAEQHLFGLGCGLIEVTSNDRLAAAHAFYEHVGYSRTSGRFAKVRA